MTATHSPSVMTRMRRPALSVVLVVLSILLAACGGTGGGKPGPGAGKGAFPVTIEHRYGTTVVPRRPTRVVTVGLTDQDVAVVLGVTPLGVRQWLGGYPSAAWPWTQPTLNDAEPAIVGDAARIDLEQVSRLRPDLILAMSSDITRAQYRELSKIAPVVAQPLPTTTGAPEWATRTRLAGRALGRKPMANAAITAAKHDFIVIRDKQPQFAGQTMVLASRDDIGRITIYGPRDQRTQFLASMGFKTPPWVAEQAGGASSFTLRPSDAATVSAQRITWIATGTQERAIKVDPTVIHMPVTITGRTTFLPVDGPPVGDALRFNTILSVRYAVDWALPLLGPGKPKS